jgi:outer membrane receptor protein involved in Fe transport
MPAAGSVLALLFALISAPGATGTRMPPPAAPADTVQPSPRVVRRFPAIEVRAPLHDLRSSQTVRVIPGAALRALPVDGLAEALALQPGVVAEGGELHVRGGRSGETTTYLDGLCLNEPHRRRSMEVPLLALRNVELVSGAPEAQYGCGLAGALDLRTVDPGARPEAQLRWTGDGGLDTRYDRVSARVGTPLRVLGLGVVSAVDGTFDDTWLPALRTPSRRRVLGAPLGWRAENRMMGYLKLAAVEPPRHFSAEVLAGRQVHRPYDPAWSLDGWTYVPDNAKVAPIFSPVEKSGYQCYRAADHLPVTDERQVAALLTLATRPAARRGALSLGWLSTRSVTSVGGAREAAGAEHRPHYGDYLGGDPFHVLWGDYPLYRESGSDVVTLRAEGELATMSGGQFRAGVGLTREHVTLREVEWLPYGWAAQPGLVPPPLDSVRSYDARAPGAFAYAQGRWTSGGLVLNAGLRAEYFTAGSQASSQTLPGGTQGVLSFSPRLGIAYPVSVRDVFSLSYARVQQAPGRDFLYDRRVVITDRQPLGNPALEPATVISYEAAVKHLLGPGWAVQASAFSRDVYGQVGARQQRLPSGPTDLLYTDEDDGHAIGLEWSLVHAEGERHRLEANYTWLQAWGNESRPEGDPYGPLRGDRIAPMGSAPLSWDRRHSLALIGSAPWRRDWSLSWSTAVGSPLPWTPKPRRQAFTDLGLVNSRRLGWTEVSNFRVQWAPARLHGVELGLEMRNLFDNRGERVATADGYPNPAINTLYDDYGAYRTETGQGGGAYWVQPPDGNPGHWVPVHDPRLYNPPRTVRLCVGANF